VSLVMAFSGRKRAIVGGDRRSITFFGEAEALEEELYDGRIRTDEELARRAEELGVRILVSDSRDKVWKRGFVLVGEVTEVSLGSDRRRRIYVTPGRYLLVDISKGRAVVKTEGKTSLVVFGNKITKRLANERLGWQRSFDHAVFKSAFEDIRKLTASISPDHTVIDIGEGRPDPRSALCQALRQDCEESGWMVSGLR